MWEIYVIIFLLFVIGILCWSLKYHAGQLREYKTEAGFYRGAYMRLRVWNVDNALKRAAMYDDTKTFEELILKGDGELARWGAPGERIIDELFPNSNRNLA